MCGIFGFDVKNGALSDGQRAIMASTLARLNDNRGGHSWGFAGWKEGDDEPQPVMRRGVGEIATQAYKILPFHKMFGHTRWATTGAKTVKNAHPFEIGNIIGAHNGMVHNHRELCSTYNREFEVDSMHLFAHLDLNLDFSEIEGYGAIEWIKKTDPTSINLCRMKNGDLSIYGFGKDQDNPLGIVWSSDVKHLVEALACAGIKHTFRFKVEEAQVYSVHNNSLYVSEKQLTISDPIITGHGTQIRLDQLEWNEDENIFVPKSPKNITNYADHIEWQMMFQEAMERKLRGEKLTPDDLSMLSETGEK